MSARAAILAFCLLAVVHAATSTAGRACLFEGSDNIATSAPTTAAMTGITAAWWFRVDTPSKDAYPILTYRNSTFGYISFAAQHQPWIYMQENEDTTLYGDDLVFALNVTGKWIHAAFTWNSADGAANIYENGKNVGSGSYLTGWTIPAGGYFVFPDLMWSQKLFGHADEITVWNTALSATEIQQVAGGSTTIRTSQRVLHWSCDEEIQTAIADDAATGAATLSVSWIGNAKGPSTCPSVSTSGTVLAVVAQSNAKTLLGLPSGVTVLSLPSSASGTLVASTGAVVTVGQVPTALYFQSVGPTMTTTSFNISGDVVVTIVKNTAPEPLVFTTEVADYGKVVTHLAYYKFDTKPTISDLAFVDAEGDALTATVMSVPSRGKLYQYVSDDELGAQVAAGSAVTDPAMRVVYVPNGGSYGLADSFTFSLSDGLQSTTATRSFTVTATTLSPTPVSASFTTDKNGEADIQLAVNYNYLNQSALLVTKPANGTLREGNGITLVYTDGEVELYQWVASVLNWSSQRSSSTSRASNLVGAPATYPHYGNSGAKWAFSGAHNGTEWVVCKYSRPVFISRVETYEIEDGNKLIGILQLGSTGAWERLWSRDVPTVNENTKAFQYNVTLSPTGSLSHLADTFKFEFANVEDQWPEIEAIRVVGYVHMTTAGVPEDYKLIYIANSTSALSTDSFEVIEVVTDSLLERLPYLFETAPTATISLKIVSSASTLLLAPLAFALLAFVSLF